MLERGSYSRLLVDPGCELSKAQAVLLCSGKVYYDLAEERAKARANVAIVRVEQFYPLPEELFLKTMAPVAPETPVYWVQEEPANMGAWPYWRRIFGSRLLERFPFDVIARPPSASPAAGSKHAHETQQHELFWRCLAVT